MEGWPHNKADKPPKLLTKLQNYLLVWKAVFGNLITSKTSFNHTGSLRREEREREVRSTTKTRDIYHTVCIIWFHFYLKETLYLCTTCPFVWASTEETHSARREVGLGMVRTFTVHSKYYLIFGILWLFYTDHALLLGSKIILIKGRKRENLRGEKYLEAPKQPSSGT